VQPPAVQNNPESFEGAYKTRKSDVNPLDAALPQSFFLKGGGKFLSFGSNTPATASGSKKPGGISKKSHAPQKYPPPLIFSV